MPQAPSAAAVEQALCWTQILQRALVSCVMDGILVEALPCNLAIT